MGARGRASWAAMLIAAGCSPSMLSTTGGAGGSSQGSGGGMAGAGGFGGEAGAGGVGADNVLTLASGQSNPTAMAVDTTRVYWTNYNDGTVRAASLDGGAVTLLATGQSGPAGIVVDSANVYWVNQGTINLDGAVMSIPLAGGG